MKFFLFSAIPHLLVYSFHDLICAGKNRLKEDSAGHAWECMENIVMAIRWCVSIPASLVPVPS